MGKRRGGRRRARARRKKATARRKHRHQVHKKHRVATQKRRKRAQVRRRRQRRRARGRIGRLTHHRGHRSRTGGLRSWIYTNGGQDEASATYCFHRMRRTHQYIAPSNLYGDMWSRFRCQLPPDGANFALILLNKNDPNLLENSKSHLMHCGMLARLGQDTVDSFLRPIVTATQLSIGGCCFSFLFSNYVSLSAVGRALPEAQKFLPMGVILSALDTGVYGQKALIVEVLPYLSSANEINPLWVGSFPTLTPAEQNALILTSQMLTSGGSQVSEEVVATAIDSAVLAMDALPIASFVEADDITDEPVPFAVQIPQNMNGNGQYSMMAYTPKNVPVLIEVPPNAPPGSTMLVNPPCSETGYYSTTLIDTSGDGVCDVVGVDTDGDGKPNKYYPCKLIDTNNDGKFDTVAFDSTGDGLLDSTQPYVS